MTTTVFLHGFTGRGSDFDSVSQTLRETHRLIRPDLFGHDPSVRVTRSIGFEDEVDRIAGLIGDAAPVRLCAYSLGARVAVGLLVRHPSLVAEAVLVAPHAGLADARERSARIAQDETWCSLLEREGIEAFVAKWEKQPIFATQSTVSAEALERQRQRRLQHDATNLSHAMRSLGLGVMPDYWPALGGVRVPVQIIVGEQDAKFVAIASALESRFANATVETAPCGHNVVLECPDVIASKLGHSR